MALKVSTIVSIVLTCCWMIKGIAGKQDETLKMRQSGNYGPPLSVSELNCIPNITKKEYKPPNNSQNVCVHPGPNKNAYPALKWPIAAKIPYEIDSAFDENERCVIGYAMKKYHDNTCIRFVPKTDETDFIQINKLNVTGFSCFTMGVGYSEGDGAHTVNFSPACLVVEERGTAMHEIMHRLGFLHEHARPDRDNYVQVKWDNIPSGWKSQYDMANDSTLILNYDYSSTMHYPLENILVPLHNTRNVQISQRKSLSKLDLMKINVMYCKL